MSTTASLTTSVSGEEHSPGESVVTETLIVFVRGLHPWNPRPSAYAAIEQLLREQLPGSEFHSFNYRGTYYSTEDPGHLADRLEREIGELIAKKTPQRVYLVGHSFGALLLRQAVVNNAQQPEGGRWLDKVEKLILLAGANRGFHPYHGGLEFLAMVARAFQRLPSWFRIGRLSVMGLRGSVWVTQLRMAWVKHSVDPDSVLPFTVQIRGARDSLVGPHDSRDISTSRRSVELVIDGVGHKDIALLRPENSDKVRTQLACKLKEALAATPQTADFPPGADHVIFLIHGIRDFAEWHEDLGETIVQIAGPGQRVEIVPISYGYFSALQFLFPTARRRCARTFLDRYVQYFARFPGARFSAVAHSNGTYALAWALRQNPFIRLENIFLAGSVLPRSFRWEHLEAQVNYVSNDCGNRDWPVGVLCWLLSWFPPYWRELGTAGVFGFKGDAVRGSSRGTRKFVSNNQYREGGHSVALESKRHDEIARFLLTGAGWTAQGLSHRSRPLRRWFLRGIGVSLVIGFGFLFCWIAIANLAPPFTMGLTLGLTLLLICFLLLI